MGAAMTSLIYHLKMKPSALQDYPWSIPGLVV